MDNKAKRSNTDNAKRTDTEWPRLIFSQNGARAEVTVTETRGPVDVAKMCRAALFAEGLISFDTYDTAAPLDVPATLCAVKGAPTAVVTEYRGPSDPRALSLARFCGYLSAVGEIGAPRARTFGEHLHAMFKRFGEWGDPDRWAVLARNVAPQNTPLEVTAVAAGAIQPEEADHVSEYRFSDSCGTKDFPGAAEALRFATLDEPSKLADPVAVLERIRGLHIGGTVTEEYPTGGHGTFTVRRLDTRGAYIRNVAPSLYEHFSDETGAGAEKCERWAATLRKQATEAAGALDAFFDLLTDAEKDIGDAVYPVRSAQDEHGFDGPEEAIEFLKEAARRLD